MLHVLHLLLKLSSTAIYPGVHFLAFATQYLNKTKEVGNTLTHEPIIINPGLFVIFYVPNAKIIVSTTAIAAKYSDIVECQL